jgi:hypothetical protein
LWGGDFLDILKGKKWDVRSNVGSEVAGKPFMAAGRACPLLKKSENKLEKAN